MNRTLAAQARHHHHGYTPRLLRCA